MHCLLFKLSFVHKYSTKQTTSFTKFKNIIDLKLKLEWKREIVDGDYLFVPHLASGSKRSLFFRCSEGLSDTSLLR